MSILRVEKLSHYYPDGDEKRHILKDNTYEFERGKLYTIMGPSGSGKTTLLSFLAGLDEPKSGKIFYSNKSINDIGLARYRKRHVSIVFQSYNLIPYLTAKENIIIAIEISGHLKGKTKVAEDTLLSVGLTEDKWHRKITKLSGGEQQRVAIARTIALNVDVICADEPTGNLDSEKEQEIIDIFKNLAHKKNKCVIIVSHSGEIEKNSDIILRLKNGILVSG
jgi:putative ABC transport system ATP-binding protein